MKFKLDFKTPTREIAAIIGSIMFASGIKDMIPQFGNIGSIIVGGLLLYWSVWRKRK